MSHTRYLPPEKTADRFGVSRSTLVTASMISILLHPPPIVPSPNNTNPTPMSLSIRQDPGFTLKLLAEGPTTQQSDRSYWPPSVAPRPSLVRCLPKSSPSLLVVVTCRIPRITHRVLDHVCNPSATVPPLSQVALGRTVEGYKQHSCLCWWNHWKPRCSSSELGWFGAPRSRYG